MVTVACNKTRLFCNIPICAAGVNGSAQGLFEDPNNKENQQP